MDFSEALKSLKDGMKVTRNGWQPGLYVKMQLHYVRNDANMALDAGARAALVYEPRLMLHHQNGDVSEWCPLGSDLFAQDWLCATADGVIRWPDGTVA